MDLKPKSNDVIRTFRKEILMGQRYPKMEDQKQKPGLPCNQAFAKGGQDLNQNLKSFRKIVNFERWRVN